MESYSDSNRAAGAVSKLCSRCGKGFRCGAAAGFCDCFSVALDETALLKIRKEFSDCLCVACLEEWRVS
ncbi:hypothetical protein EHQ12_05845 [Leptospira gomenensis]|uniref:Cysteine-rich CWC family protein n=1 Tax=Leptospira gomenensis TaxID=2484974 RepID=A0A5F1Z0X5_9LEPT|nr:cysteine-rich CWC family protein [Leptospira gomenensis]TGK36091.1 hypothetical protein EHQ17_05670 [Leptospira gomenensis]TGK41821.1 hypothetical protein EHQ12_05845 [Leptospira gomenensis]TGK53388.1 hypothetical protein EHQ07_00060 [Leptospira gomenensis]TGK64971.1 hypothetical protein EHQ13_06305 [Leptospira gomenensis]